MTCCQKTALNLWDGFHILTFSDAVAILVPVELKVMAASGLSCAGIIVTALCNHGNIRLRIREEDIQKCECTVKFRLFKMSIKQWFALEIALLILC